MSHLIFKLDDYFEHGFANNWIGAESLGFQATELGGGYSRGVQIVRLQCWDKSIEILPTRGLGIWQAHRADIRFGWDSPIQGPVHPQYVNLSEPSGLGWLDGFDEMMVRCGLGSNGAPDFDAAGKLAGGLHGKIANLPAQDVEIEIDEASQSISISGLVIERRFLFYRWALKSRITLSRHSPEIEIVDQIENQSDRDSSIQMLYHCNFGPPILESGSRFFAPVNQVMPRDETAQSGFSNWNLYQAPDNRFSEQVYFLELAADQAGQSLALVTNEQQNLGAYVRFAVGNLPYFTLWKNTVGLRDGYVTGLEPGTNYPNPRQTEEKAGRVVQLAGGESIEFNCAIGMLVEESEVKSMRDRIAKIGATL